MSRPSTPKARPGEILFTALFVLGAVVLVWHLDSETKFSAKGNLFAQPRFWPAVGVIGMAVFGLLHLATSWRHRAPGGWFEAGAWLRAFEYFFWFMVYVWVVPILGYLLATMLFTLGLALRQGYFRQRQLFVAALLGVVIVVVFKTILQVKIPGGALYEHLPDAIRNFMIVNF